MKKRFTMFSVFLLILVSICPIRVNAVTIPNSVESYTKSTYKLAGSDYENKLECNGDGLIGNPEDPDSVAWLLQLIFNIVKVVGPILVVILSSVDFIKVIVKSDDEAMAKAQKKLIIRMILALLLFLIPTIVQVILQVFGIYGDPTCNIK